MKKNQLLESILLGLSCYILPYNIASAEIENIEATGSYSVGDNETENFASARENAYNEAMRSAVEQAGVYVESYSKTQNMQLTHDEVRIISGNILKVLAKDIRPVVSTDGHTIKFICTIKATVDTDSINLQEKMHQHKLEDENNTLRQEIANLKRQLQGTSPTDDINSLRQRAENGDREAQYNYAIRLYYGEGIARNDDEAIKWFRKAAEQGDVDAQFILGACYDAGEGVAQSYDEAVKWYKKAAEQGQPEAQYNLGVCYKRGRGIAKNYDEAVKWYRKAAAQGNTLAQKALNSLRAF